MNVKSTSQMTMEIIWSWQSSHTTCMFCDLQEAFSDHLTLAYLVRAQILTHSQSHNTLR